MVNINYDIGSIISELEKKDKSSSGGGFQNDFWKPTLPEGQERAEYIIRFLPNLDGETPFPWVERHAHMFKFGSGKFLYEACPKKAGKGDCFICEEVSKLFGTGDPQQEALAKKRYIKKRYYHNILVVKDPREGGQNEGKVLIYEAGDQIYKKCDGLLNDKELELAERCYFHPTHGTNFNLVVEKKSGFPNYDSSYFSRKVSPIILNGEPVDVEEGSAFIEKSCFKLNERLFGGKTFKSYDDIKSLYLNQGQKPTSSESKEEEVNETVDQTINHDPISVRNPVDKVEPSVQEPKKEDDPIPFDVGSSDEDADLQALLGNA